LVGSYIAANSKGVLLPSIADESEIQIIKHSLPHAVKVAIVYEKMSALGNIIATNDKIALIHPDTSKETEEIIENTLGVETYRT